MPCLKCLTKDKIEYALYVVHEGLYGNHLEVRKISHKLLREGYYSPTLKKHIAKLLWNCENCQTFLLLNMPSIK